MWGAEELGEGKQDTEKLKLARGENGKDGED